MTSDLSTKYISGCVALTFDQLEFGTSNDEADLGIGWVDNRGIMDGIKWAKIHILACNRHSGDFIRAVCPK